MGADEIVDWMAFELTQNTDFLDRLAKTPQALEPEAEAAAIKKMLLGLGK